MFMLEIPEQVEYLSLDGYIKRTGRFIEKNYSDERRPPQKAIRTKSVLQNGTNEKARENPGFFASFGVT